MSGNTRSYPSNIWAALALPFPPIGSIPFVDTDGASITTDILHFFYTSATQGTVFNKYPYQLTAWGGLRQGAVNLSNVFGTLTINAPAGRVTMPAGNFTLTVRCSYVKFGSTIILPTMRALDNTMTRLIVQTIAEGQFLLLGNAPATANVDIDFIIFNVDYTGP